MMLLATPYICRGQSSHRVPRLSGELSSERGAAAVYDYGVRHVPECEDNAILIQ